MFTKINNVNVINKAILFIKILMNVPNVILKTAKNVILMGLVKNAKLDSDLIYSNQNVYTALVENMQMMMVNAKTNVKKVVLNVQMAMIVQNMKIIMFSKEMNVIIHALNAIAKINIIVFNVVLQQDFMMN